MEPLTSLLFLSFFFFNDTATTEIYTLSLHDALPISAATHHSKSDYNLFEGTEVTGVPQVVLLRGNVLVEGDELVASPGIGQFVARAKFGQELKPRVAVA